MDIVEYAKQCEKTWLRTRHETYEDRISYLLISLTGELGELMNLWKKVLRGDPEARAQWDLNRYQELGDVFWYVTVLAAELLGLEFRPDDPDFILGLNVAKLRSRLERGVIEGSGDDR